MSSLNRTFNLSPHENIRTIALITIHYLYNIEWFEFYQINQPRLPNMSSETVGTFMCLNNIKTLLHERHDEDNFPNYSIKLCDDYWYQ